MEIGNQIAKLRKKIGLSQEELAEKIGVARQTISKWELGETSPDLKQSKQLSKIFNVSLDELTNNEIKDILEKKVSNTERLSKLILRGIKIIGIIIGIYIIYNISLIVYYRFIYVPKDVNLDKITIECILHDETYSYEFEYESNTGYIRYETSESNYLKDVTDTDKYNDVYKVIHIIDAYVKNNGGSCVIKND